MHGISHLHGRFVQYVDLRVRVAERKAKDSMASSKEMLAQIDTAWIEWLESLEGLTDDQLSQANAAGEWSCKDLMNHVAFWDGQAASETKRRSQGAPPRKNDWQKMNDDDAAANRDRSPSESRARMLASHQQLIDLLEELRDFDESWVNDDTWNHYPEHAVDIRNWRKEAGY
jgi:DinB superfamily